MPAEPTFLMDMETEASTFDFLAAPASRRGDGIAWLCVVAVAYVLRRTGSLALMPILFFAFVLTLATVSSFGNWVNNNTRIRISPSYIRYQSPLRRI